MFYVEISQREMKFTEFKSRGECEDRSSASSSRKTCEMCVKPRLHFHGIAEGGRNGNLGQRKYVK